MHTFASGRGLTGRVQCRLAHTARSGREHTPPSRRSARDAPDQPTEPLRGMLPTSKQTASTPPPAVVYLDRTTPGSYHQFSMITHRPAHTHEARILRFADADTVVVLLRGLFGIWSEHYLRLEGIESWELDSADGDRARTARNALDSMLKDRCCLVHLTSHGHDKYARLRGRVTVGETDLAHRIVELGFAWPCTPKASSEGHMARRVAAAAATSAGAGCTVVRDGSSWVSITGTNAVSGDISQHGAGTLPTHPTATAIIIIAIIAVVGAVVWLIHNRGKLAALASKIAGV